MSASGRYACGDCVLCGQARACACDAIAATARAPTHCFHDSCCYARFALFRSWLLGGDRHGRYTPLPAATSNSTATTSARRSVEYRAVTGSMRRRASGSRHTHKRARARGWARAPGSAWLYVYAGTHVPKRIGDVVAGTIRDCHLSNSNLPSAYLPLAGEPAALPVSQTG